MSPEAPVPVRAAWRALFPREATFCAPREGPRALLRCVLCQTIIAVAAPWRVEGFVTESRCRDCSRPAFGSEN